MATIEKRGDSYKIVVSNGYDINGKQLRVRMTWEPEPGMTQRQINKELNRQATLFEEKVLSGQYISDAITFKDFADRWLKDYAEIQLKLRTVHGYKIMLPTIYQAIGHIQLKKLQPHHLIAFYNALGEPGIRRDTKYLCKVDFKQLLKTHRETKAAFSLRAGVGVTTLDQITRGESVSLRSAEKISSALGAKVSKLFEPVGKETLSGTTILKYHRLISSILTTAVHWQVIPSNPCSRVKAPRADTPEAIYLDESDAISLLELLDGEEIRFRTMVQLLLFTGMRRAELFGLEWSDIDYKLHLIDISKSALYIPKKGIITDTPKNKSSKRIIKASPIVFEVLKQYQAWQVEQRFSVGDQWKGSPRVFTTLLGAPIHPDTLTKWFHSFIKRHDALPPACVHSLRHTNASLQIANGIPITTIAKRLGHTTPATTTRIYAHAIRSADEAAAEVLQNLLKTGNNVAKTS